MEYDPNYYFSERFFIESIVFDGFDPAMTLLVRFDEGDGISSQKHIFCQPNQLGKLLMGIDEKADRVLTRLVELLSFDKLECPEVLNVESLLGHPLTVSNWRVGLYHPIIKNDMTGADEIDFEIYDLYAVWSRIS